MYKNVCTQTPLLPLSLPDPKAGHRYMPVPLLCRALKQQQRSYFFSYFLFVFSARLPFNFSAFARVGLVTDKGGGGVYIGRISFGNSAWYNLMCGVIEMASAFKFLTARTNQLELELTLCGASAGSDFLGWDQSRGRGREVHFCLFVLLTFCCMCVFLCVCSLYAVGALN